jgi:hypothetical protein
MDMKQVNIPKCIWKSWIHFNPTDLLYNFFGKNQRVKKTQGNEEEMIPCVTCWNLSLTEKLLLCFLVSIKRNTRNIAACNYSDSLLNRK